MKVTKTALRGEVIIEPRLFDNHRGRPTYASRIAEVVREVIDHWQLSGLQPSGIYHRISTGKTSWFGLAQENFLRTIVAGVLEQALRLRPPSKLDTSKLEQSFVAYLAGLAKRAEKYH